MSVILHQNASIGADGFGYVPSPDGCPPLKVPRGCVIAALTGLAGSVVVGDGVRVGGAVGIAGHLRIGDGATIAGKSAVTRDVPPGKTYYRYPDEEYVRELRPMAALRKLPEWMRRASRLLKAQQRSP